MNISYIIAFIVFLIVVYFVFKTIQNNKQKNKSSSSSNNVISSNGGNLFSNAGNLITSTLTNNNLQNSNLNNSTSNKYQIGDSLTSEVGGTNTYNSVNFGTSSFFKHYNEDEYVGSFLSYEGLYSSKYPNKIKLIDKDNKIVYTLDTSVY